MELTPVRIRGKKRKPTAAATTPKLALSSQAKRLRTSKSTKNTKTKKIVEVAMPTLQGMPQELLEMIFLYSMNMSLPRASHSLGRKLSSSAVIMEFVMRSFYHTVDHKTNHRDREKTGDPEIQSQLLTCRFFTWSFFRTYVERARSTLIQQRGRIWKDASVDVPGLKSFDGLIPFKFLEVNYLAFAEGFRIPEKLLHGPWSVDKAALLYVLVSLNGELDWRGSLAGETAKAGMREAIEGNHERAVAALAVLLGVAQNIDTSTIRYAVIDCGCNINIVRQLLFNAQILQHNSPKESLSFHGTLHSFQCDSHMLTALLSSDPALWRWADAHEGKGVLLKDLLRKADKFSLEFYLEGEEGARAKIVPFPYGGTKFDPRTVFEEMGRELLVRLYQTYGRKITATRRRRQRTQENSSIES